MAEEIDCKKIAKLSNRGTHKIIHLLGYHPRFNILTFASRSAHKNTVMHLYNRLIVKEALRIGIKVDTTEYPYNISQKTLLTNIRHLNEDPKIDAILLQYPLPKHLNKIRVSNAISASKDADGVNDLNIGHLSSNMNRTKHFYTINSTAFGIIRMLDYRYLHSSYASPKLRHGDTAHEILDGLYHGLRATIIGRSSHIDKALEMILSNRGCEVTVLNKYICHSTDAEHGTRDYIPARYTYDTNLLIAAINSPGLITSQNIMMNSSIVIDASESHSPANFVTGDVTDAARRRGLAYTPVPGGVGLLTIATLLRQVAELAGDEKGSIYDPIIIK